MKKFEPIDISGDVGMRAFGATIEEAFINEAMGMYSLITNPEDIKTDKTIRVSIESHSPEGLLVSWLNELIFWFETQNFIGVEIEIQSLNPSPRSPSLRATIRGGEFDPERHERKLLIKAATYHRLKIEKVNDIWEVDVIFDI